jgi:uncharacterized protein
MRRRLESRRCARLTGMTMVLVVFFCGVAVAQPQAQTTRPVALTLAAMGIIVAAFVKGATGIGFPVIGAPIAALFLDPQTTVVAITLPAFLMNVIQTIQGGVSLALVRRFLPTLLVLVPAAVGGTALLAYVPGSLLVLILGVIVTAYAVISLWHPRLVLPPAYERWAGISAGLCAGVIGGATSIFSPPLVMYIAALQLPKAAFVSAVSMCFLGGQIPQLVSLVGFGLLTAPRLGVAALFCVLSAVGFLLGLRLQRHISQTRFAQMVLITLLVVGLSLLRTGFMGLR